MKSLIGSATLLALGLVSLTLRAAPPAVAWSEKDSRLANEYLSLLVERPEYGRVIDLLWELYAKRDATKLLLSNIHAQATASKHPSVLLVEAHLLRKSGDLKAAAALYDEVLRLTPKDSLALRPRAEVAAELGDMALAMKWQTSLAEALADADPAKPQAWMQLGNLALSAGKPTEAAAAWERAAKLRPTDMALARSVAQSLLRAGFPERAAAFLEAVAKAADPQQRLDALFDLARVHEYADQFAKADAALREGLAILDFHDARYAEFFLRRVRLHERFGQLDELRTLLEKDATRQPPSELALSNMVRFAAAVVDVDERLRWLRELVKLAPQADNYRWELVRALLDHEGAEEAAKLLDERLRGDASDVAALVLLRAEAELRLGKNEAATARLKALLTTQGMSADVEKAVLAFAQERSLDAIIEQVLLTRMQREAGKPEPVFELATFYKSRQQSDKAAALLESFARGQAEALPDGNAAADANALSRYNDAASFLAAGGLKEEALRLAERAAKLSGQGREELVRLADMLADAGRMAEAMKLLEQALGKCASYEERFDVEDRIFAALAGAHPEAEKKVEPAATSTEFKLPAFLSGEGFGSDAAPAAAAGSATKDETETQRPLANYARAIIDKALDPAADEAALVRGIWWLRQAFTTGGELSALGKVLIATTPAAQLKLGKSKATDAASSAATATPPAAQPAVTAKDLLNQFKATGKLPPTLPPQPSVTVVESLKQGSKTSPQPAQPSARDLWWARESRSTRGVYQLLSRLLIDPVKQDRRELPLELERLVLDFALTDENRFLASRQLGILIQRDPSNRAQYRLRLAEQALAENQPEQAAQELEAAYKEQPGSESLLAALTQCYQLLRQPDKALPLWREAISRASGTAANPLRERYAELLLRAQKLPEHIEAQVDIVEAEPDIKRRRELFKRFIDRLAWSDTAGGDLADSVIQDRLKMVQAALTERSRRHPFDGFFHEALAAVHEKRGEAAKAFAAMRQAYYTSPDTPFSLDQLRAAALRVGDLKAAIYFQKQIVATAPAKDVASESRQLVQLLEQTFQIAEADKVRRRLESRFSQDPTALEDLARYYKETGQDEAERRVYEQIERVRSWDARSTLRLALKCLAVSDEAAAEKHLRDLLKRVQAKNSLASLPPERWPFPLSDERKTAAAASLKDELTLLEGTRGLGEEESERLRGYLAFPRPELVELPDDVSLVRLRAIEELAKLTRSQGGKALQDWVAQWSGQSAATLPIERLWALFYAGADRALLSVLEESIGRAEALDLEFVFAWLGLRSRGMAEVIAWGRGKGLSEESRTRRQRLLQVVAGMLAEHKGFAFEPAELRLLATSETLTQAALLQMVRSFQDAQRHEEAMAVVEGLRQQSVELRGYYAYMLAGFAQQAEQWERQRQYLLAVLAEPTEPGSYSGEDEDPYILSATALARLARSPQERSQLITEALRQLDAVPASSLTTVRKAALMALAGAAQPAVERLGKYAGGEFISQRTIAQPTGLMPQNMTRLEDNNHLRTYWTDLRYAGAIFARQGLGQLADAVDNRVYAELGGVPLGPRGSDAFTSWRNARLIRELRVSNHPQRVRLIREHLASVDLREEDSVDTLTELGRELELVGMMRDCIEIYRGLPARAPTNNLYASYYIRVCELAMEPVEAREYVESLFGKDPVYKPQGIGDEVLREKHALFLAMEFNEARLAALGLKPEGFTRVMQGRIPDEVPYLRELALLREKLGDKPGALAAWQGVQAALDSVTPDALPDPDLECSGRRAALLHDLGRDAEALKVLRIVVLKLPLGETTAALLKQRGEIAAALKDWEDFRPMMSLAVDGKSAATVLALAALLEAAGRTTDELNYLTQAERSLKSDDDRFALRLAKLRLLARAADWTPEAGRAAIAALLRSGSHLRSNLEALQAWLSQQSREASPAKVQAWIKLLRAETRSGSDPTLAATALLCFAQHLPDETLPPEVARAWRTTKDRDRDCLELAAAGLIEPEPKASASIGPRLATWAQAACDALRNIPAGPNHSRLQPIMLRVAAAAGDEAKLHEVYADLVRMPIARAEDVRRWGETLEAVGHADLTREYYQQTAKRFEEAQLFSSEVSLARFDFLLRQQAFEQAEALLLREYEGFIPQAAPKLVALYQAWGRLGQLDAELPKYWLPKGLENEVRFLAKQR